MPNATEVIFKLKSRIENPRPPGLKQAMRVKGGISPSQGGMKAQERRGQPTSPWVSKATGFGPAGGVFCLPHDGDGSELLPAQENRQTSTAWIGPLGWEATIQAISESFINKLFWKPPKSSYSNYPVSLLNQLI